MDIFENIISFKKLYQSFRVARLGKRHKKEVIEYEMNLSQNLWKLHYDLKYNKYRVKPYNTFKIYDPKERLIQATSFEDRIVQHSLCDNYLSYILDKHLIYDNCACRKGKGTSFAFKRVKHFMRLFYKQNGNNGYIIKFDISKYFPSINHNILKNKLLKVIKDKNILNLLYIIIDSFSEDGKGLPMGNQTSQAFALLYLDYLDRYIKEKERIKYYIRYMDDGLIFVSNKEDAVRILHQIEKLLTKVKLKLNPKSQIIKASRKVTFLGYNFFYGNNGKIVVKVKKQTKKRIKNNLNNKIYQYSNNQINESMLNMTKQSYIAYLKNVNEYKLVKEIKYKKLINKK